MTKKTVNGKRNSSGSKSLSPNQSNEKARKSARRKRTGSASHDLHCRRDTAHISDSERTARALLASDQRLRDTLSIEREVAALSDRTARSKALIALQGEIAQLATRTAVAIILPRMDSPSRARGIAEAFRHRDLVSALRKAGAL